MKILSPEKYCFPSSPLPDSDDARFVKSSSRQQLYQLIGSIKQLWVKLGLSARLRRLIVSRFAWQRKGRRGEGRGATHAHGTFYTVALAPIKIAKESQLQPVAGDRFRGRCPVVSVVSVGLKQPATPPLPHPRDTLRVTAQTHHHVVAVVAPHLLQSSRLRVTTVAEIRPRR